MSLYITSLNDLLSFGVDIAASWNEVDARVLFSDFVFYLAYWDRLIRSVSLLVKHTLDAKVGLVHVEARGDCGRYCRE